MGFFHAVERKIDVDMTDLLSDESIRNRGILRQNFELVCSARCRNDISRKYVLFLMLAPSQATAIPSTCCFSI